MKKRNRALASATVLSLVLTSTVTATNVQAAAEVTRVPGANRETTAMEVGKQVFKAAETVVLVNGYGYADAVSATPLAKALNAPILLTNKVDALTAELTATLASLGAKKIVIVGGEGAVTKAMAEALDANYEVSRIGGTNRYETNAAVAKEVLAKTGAKAGVLVSAEGYADALSVASIAAAKGMPVLFGNSKTVPAEVQAVAAGLEVAAVGGEAVLPASVLSAVNAARVAQGANRFETNLAVLDHFKVDLKLDNLYIAAGGAKTTDFADALVASAAAAKNAAPVVLTGAGAKEENVTAANDYITKKMNEKTKVTVIGGTSSVSASIVNKLQDKANEINGITGEIVVHSVQGTTEEVDLSKDYPSLGFTINGGREVTTDDLENEGYKVEFVASEDVLTNAETGSLDKADLEIDETFEYQVIVKDINGNEVARSEVKKVKVVNSLEKANEITKVKLEANGSEVKNNKISTKDEGLKFAQVKYKDSKNVETTITDFYDNEDKKQVVKFTSSNPEVAFVDKEGVITTVKEGTTTLTAEVGGLKKEVKITVVDEKRIPNKSTLEATSVKMGKGAEKDIKVTILDQFGDAMKDISFDTLKDVKNGGGNTIATAKTVDSNGDDTNATSSYGAIYVRVTCDDIETGLGKLYLRASYTDSDGKSKTVLLGTISVEVTGLTKIDSRKLETVSSSDDYELDLSFDDSVKLAYNKYNSNGVFLGRELSGGNYTAVSSDNEILDVDFNGDKITVKPVGKTGTAYVKILENGIVRASGKITVVNNKEKITAAKFETAKITNVQTIDLDTEVLKPANITVENKKGVTRIAKDGTIYLDLDNDAAVDGEDVLLGKLKVYKSSVYDDNKEVTVTLNETTGQIEANGGKFQYGTTGTIIVKIFDTEADTDGDGKTVDADGNLNDVIASGTITIDIAK